MTLSHAEPLLLSVWALATEVRLLLGGDLPSQVPASCLSCHLKPPHLQTDLRVHRAGGGKGRRAVPVRLWDTFEVTLLGFKH